MALQYVIIIVSMYIINLLRYYHCLLIDVLGDLQIPIKVRY